jgi:hypothetical protein
LPKSLCHGSVKIWTQFPIIEPGHYNSCLVRKKVKKICKNPELCHSKTLYLIDFEKKATETVKVLTSAFHDHATSEGL